MRHGLGGAARYWLFPDVDCAVYTVEESNGVPIGGPMHVATASVGHRQDFGRQTTRKRNDRQCTRPIGVWKVPAGDPLAVWGDRRKIGVVIGQRRHWTASTWNLHQNRLTSLPPAKHYPQTIRRYRRAEVV